MRQATRWRKSAASKLRPERIGSASAPDDSAMIAAASLSEGEFTVNVEAPMRELLPGFVHMQGVLPMLTQQSLLNVSCSVAAESRHAGFSGGWYRKGEDGRWTLNDGSKARFWDDISRFPASFKVLGENLAKLAGEHFPEHLASPALKFDARIGALNFYTGRGRMGWHVDDTNFAKPGRPIVMASLGDAADFGYKMRKEDAERSVRLESGDAIVFGGAAHDLVHALLQVRSATSPEGLTFPDLPGVGRVSVTWRDVGREDGLTFNSDERLGLRVTDQTLPRYRKAAGRGKSGNGLPLRLMQQGG